MPNINDNSPERKFTSSYSFNTLGQSIYYKLLELFGFSYIHNGLLKNYA